MKLKTFIGTVGVAATAAILLALSCLAIVPTRTVPKAARTASPDPVVTAESYTLGDRAAFYVKYGGEFDNSPGVRGVTVYAAIAGNRTEIIPKFPANPAGGTWPEFKRTSDQHIAELAISMGDSGLFLSKSAFIDLYTQKFVQVFVSNEPYLEITDASGRVTELGVSIKDSCGTGESRGYGMDASLEGLVLNGELQTGLISAYPLKCTGPLELGSAYSPRPLFEVSGVSSDLKTVYFSLTSEDWKHDFLFDVESGTVERIIPREEWVSYTNDRYGFSVSYPPNWTVHEALEDDASGWVVSFRSPRTARMLNQRFATPGDTYELVISYCPTIDSDCARGGSWLGQKPHASLNDLLTDSKSTKQKVGDITVDGVSAYEVAIGGYGVNYGVMIERDGIYELSFTSTADRSSLSEVQRGVLDSFKFLRD